MRKKDTGLHGKREIFIIKILIQIIQFLNDILFEAIQLPQKYVAPYY